MNKRFKNKLTQHNTLNNHTLYNHAGSGTLSLCSWAPGNHRSGFHDFQLPGYVLCHNLQEEEEKEKESEVKEEKVKGEEVK